MNVEVEILKGTSRGKRKSISPSHAKALSAVGFLKILSEESEQEEVKPKRSYRRKDMVAEA